jgi:hypothetical protein
VERNKIESQAGGRDKNKGIITELNEKRKE